MIVVDDQLLLAILRGRHLPEMERAPYATTLCWLYRASRAVNAGTGKGAMSRELRDLPSQHQAQIRSLLNDLPATITTVDLRNVTPAMTALSTFGPANLPTLEAVATALVLDATLAIATMPPMLDRVARAAGIDLELVAL